MTPLDQRRGQVISHVFVFLIGAFVMAAIALLGWRAVSTLGEQQCAAQETAFTHDLQEAFASNFARGKTRTHAFTLPCDADQVCFVSRSVIDAASAGVPSSISDVSPAISTSIESGEQTNVFLRRGGVYEPVSAFGFPAPVGELTDDILCFEGSDFEIRFQRTGPDVLVGNP